MPMPRRCTSGRWRSEKRLLVPIIPMLRYRSTISRGLYPTQGRYADVEPLFTRRSPSAKRHSVPTHPDVALSLNNLAGLYHTQGRYSDAERLWKRVTSNGRKSARASIILMLQFRSTISRGLYRTQGRYADAEPLYKRSLSDQGKGSWSRSS